MQMLHKQLECFDEKQDNIAMSDSQETSWNKHYCVLSNSGLSNATSKVRNGQS